MRFGCSVLWVRCTWQMKEANRHCLERPGVISLGLNVMDLTRVFVAGVLSKLSPRYCSSSANDPLADSQTAADGLFLQHQTICYSIIQQAK